MTTIEKYITNVCADSSDDRAVRNFLESRLRKDFQDFLDEAVTSQDKQKIAIKLLVLTLELTLRVGAGMKLFDPDFERVPGYKEAHENDS